MIDTLIELATEAGIAIREIYESGKFSTSIKSDRTPVTTADEEANKIILRGLKQQFPKIPAISEESENRVLEKEAFFIIDPLDGTKGFLNKTNNFTVNIAFINNREPELGVIYSPISGELFIKKENYLPNYNGQKHQKISGLKNIPLTGGIFITLSFLVLFYSYDLDLLFLLLSY